MADRAKAKRERTPTEYVVLIRIMPLGATKLADVYPPSVLDMAPLQDGSWVEVGRASKLGRTGRAKAIEEIAGDHAGAFKAVEAKSWDTGEERFEQTTMVGRPLGSTVSQ